jgi:hypothetical protein
MLTNIQKIGMAVALVVCCIVLAMVSFASGWDHMPDNQKELLLNVGIFSTVFVFPSCCALYALYLLHLGLESSEEMEEYNNRMANQFNVGRCYSPRNWLGADDYRRLAAGSRK